MKVEISEEIIKGAIDEQIKARVKQFFGEHRDYIQNEVRSVVQDIVETELVGKHLDINKIAKEFEIEEVINRVSMRVSSDIASAFADKYDY